MEWARIEPVEGSFDDGALEHYAAIIDGCHARGIRPLVTLSHFTAPHWFAMKGGWLNEGSAELFARFTDVVMTRMGDGIESIVTLNEPNLHELLAWSGLPPFISELERATLSAAGAAAGVERYRAGNVMLAEDFDAMQRGLTQAHLAAKSVAKSHRPELPVGLTLAMADDVAVGGGEELRDRKRAAAYGHWLELARDDDFVGVQNYEQIVYGPGGVVRPEPGVPVNDHGTVIASESLRGSVEYAHSISGVPILVSEHGMSTSDDSLRAAFLEPSLDGLAEAIAGGVPVIGYCHWTLMNNFEWIFGYSRQLGLYDVDWNNFTRTPKPSADVYRQLVARYSAGSH